MTQQKHTLSYGSIVLTIFICTSMFSYQILESKPFHKESIDTLQKKICSTWHNISFDTIQAKIVQGWKAIPDDIKEYGLALATSVLIGYITAKIFHKLLKESAQIAFNIYRPGQIHETFDNVAGLQEAKRTLKNILYFFNNPQVFKTIGAKLPHGILLTGDPGNGKTLLARAMAGEAQCNFISVNGSDFVEMFVGVGAARIKELFATARNLAPCIIFIDEIDALARARGSINGSQEHDNTLNQLLKELDGFESKDHKTVMVLAATNNPSILDPAITRPGRFDRIIHIDYPDLATREAILKIHLQNIPYINIDLHSIAQRTADFSGAALANLVNQAAILAVYKHVSKVSMQEFEEVLTLLRLELNTAPT